MRRLQFIALLILVLLLLFVGLHSYFRTSPLHPPQLISHRGAAGLAPENTLAGIQAAAVHGAQLVELDVQRSADGVLLLLHDTTVDRTTNGYGAVASLNWDTLSALNAAHHSAPAAIEPIPTLTEAITVANTTGVTLVLELKSPELYPGIATQVTERINQLSEEHQVIIISFASNSLTEIRTHNSEMLLGALSVYPFTIPAEAQFVSVHWLSVLIDPSLIHRMHQRGYPVWVWTVNNRTLMQLLLWLGVDGITTDYPNRWPGFAHPLLAD